SATVSGDAQGDTARFTSIESEFAKAPAITRERMYLSTMQEILENSSKVMIDSQSSNNMLYLPLDKIMSQVAGSRTASSHSIDNPAAAIAATAQPSKPASTPATTRTPDTGGSSNSLMTSPYSR